MTTASAEQIRVLHVDDEPQFADLTATFLERESDRFGVETATSADEGLAVLDDRPPDCIVSDYNMPGTDGIEFLETVRETDPELPFILFTGRGSEQVASDAMTAGVTDYLQKGSGSEQYELLANRIQNAVRARRDAERAARQDELMRLTEVAGDTGGFELDVESETILLTHGTRQIIGRPDQTEISLTDAVELFYPDDRDRIQETLTRAIQEGEEVRETSRLQPEGGDDRLLNMTITPVTENGEVTKLRGAGHDVTDRRERQRKLEQIETLFGNAQDALFLIDVGEEFTVERVNPAYEEVTGLSNDEIRGQTPRDVLGEQPGAAAEAKYADCVEQREPLQYEEQARIGGKLTHWVTTIAPVVVDDTVEHIAGSTRNVTEKRDRERQLTGLNEATQSLQTTESRQEIAEVGVEAAEETLGLGPSAVYVSDADETRLLPVARAAEVTSPGEERQAIPVADSIAGRAYRDGEPAVVDDVREDPDAHALEADLRGHVYFPLGDHGVMIVGSEERAAFDTQDLAVGELLAGDLAAALDRLERERTARERQQQLSLFFDESPLGAVQWDEEFRFERLNEQAEELLGYSEAELRGESWETIVADEDRGQVGDVVAQLLSADGGTHSLNRNVRKNGEIRTCEWHNRAVTDGDGEVRSIFSKFQDVTDRERRKTELEEYETIIGALSDAVYVLDEEGRFTYVNEEFVELVGYDRETVLGSAPSLIKDADAVDQAERQLGRLLSSDGPETVAFEVTVHPRDGDPIVCEDHMGVLPYEGDQFEGSVGTLQDITHHRERERELQELKGQYQTLVENFPDGAIYLYDTDLRVVRAGGTELSEVGLSPEEMKGTTVHDRYPADIAEELTYNLESALAGEGNTFEQEYQGEQYRIRTVPVRTDDGRITHAMATSQNITEQKADRRELETQNERLEEFASIVSHDLQSPLSVAEGRLELAQEDCESDHLGEAADAIDRSQALIEDLLTLARGQREATEVEPVGLAEVAEQGWETVETPAATLDVEVTRTLQADSSRLQQLLENLYRNAVEHGGEGVTVRVGATEEGFYVADTGSGVPESERDEIFEAGYSTAAAGTGFGLRIVEQIVDAHGWEIAVADSEQGGTRFEVTGVAFDE